MGPVTPLGIGLSEYWEALVEGRSGIAPISSSDPEGLPSRIAGVWRKEAYRIPVSSTKSMTGHLLGAAGGVEAIATAMVLHEGIIPPTINLENPDPECDLDYVPCRARRAEVGAALSNSFGFGGHNACLALKSWDGE